MYLWQTLQNEAFSLLNALWPDNAFKCQFITFSLLNLAFYCQMAFYCISAAMGAFTANPNIFIAECNIFEAKYCNQLWLSFRNIR